MTGIHDSLAAEAKAFDERIMERVKNGFIPDLQNMEPNDWFFNNPWRRKEYADFVFGQYLAFALEKIQAGSRVLEIGCGMGHMTLELARNGFDVTGLELSSASLEIARKTKDTYGIGDKGGKLNYIHSDFMSFDQEGAFDVVCFFLTFHHFEDPARVIEKIKTLLKPGGTIIVVEPARDWFSEQNAIVVTLIRMLLAQFGGWHQPLNLPENYSEMQSYVTEYLNEYKEAKDKNEAEQSPNDNSSYADHMIASLDEVFDRTDLRAANSLTPRLLGGVRAESEEKMLAIARFLKMFDDYALDKGLLQPGAFMYSGTLKK